jgi:hypothetical protein
MIPEANPFGKLSALGIEMFHGIAVTGASTKADITGHVAEKAGVKGAAIAGKVGESVSGLVTKRLLSATYVPSVAPGGGYVYKLTKKGKDIYREMTGLEAAEADCDRLKRIFGSYLRAYTVLNTVKQFVKNPLVLAATCENTPVVFLDGTVYRHDIAVMTYNDISYFDVVDGNISDEDFYELCRKKGMDSGAYYFAVKNIAAKAAVALKFNRWTEDADAEEIGKDFGFAILTDYEIKDASFLF